ncbi:TetR/AcrR family transcriptional regulator [Acidovorax lacteus]|uniref:TetR/AcrR family transcriptional regulator n=1 Tax=Acidovorax lacteus TaxID=1924988 RepID=A0ABP8LDE9_9BURK
MPPPVDPASTPPSAATQRRRAPRQERAQVTVEAIFEAVAQIVATEGEAALTTNRIAERAGVSVGSLYQYFPSKEAIVTALLDRHCTQVMRELDALLAQALHEHWPTEQQVRRYVRHYLQAFGGGPESERALARLAWRQDERAALLVAVRGASERLALHLQRLARQQGLPVPDAAQLFVLTRGVMGAVRAASLEASPLLGSAELEDALVRLCLAVLGLPPPPTPTGTA